jgi:O-acetyl-ADP-ribose deacetylase (regulator of RNase III)
MISERLELIKGDITTLKVDAIVNAANRTLLGGGGVDGAIHKAAGPLLLEECIKLNGCEVGNAKLTKGYKLKAKYIIHTVGPVWHGGRNNESEFLAECYRNSLKLAMENGIRTVAFPGISTGVYGFPKDQAAVIAVSETSKILKNNKLPEKVIFVTFDEESFQIYKKLLPEK